MMKSAIDNIRFCLLNNNLEKSIAYEEERLRCLLSPGQSSLMKRNQLLILRRWNSYTPALRTYDPDSVGGGYFLIWNGKGIVIDPGMDFIRNFQTAGLKVADIDAIVLTHAHLDHYADFEALLILLYEYNDGQKDKKDTKQIKIFANQGSLRKCSGWLDMLHREKAKDAHKKTEIARIYTLDPFMQKEAQWIFDKENGIQLLPTEASHHEIIASGYCVGLRFDLYLPGQIKPQVRLGLTGDTGWDPIIHKQYQKCDLLIIHLGSVKEKELVLGELYGNHIGLLGTTKMLTDKTFHCKMAIISEFGEELKPFRRLIMKTLVDEITNKYLKVYAGDVGTRVLLHDTIRLQCEFADCTRDAEPVDIYETNGIVRHYCKEHIRGIVWGYTSWEGSKEESNVCIG